MNKYQEALKFLYENIDCGMNMYLDEMVGKNLEIISELVDKATPKKLIKYSHSKEWHCPNCGTGNGQYEGTIGTHNYCHYCGQKLKWEEKDE